MALLDIFDRVVIINLPNRTDRRQEMRSMLRRVGWDSESAKVTWFPGIDPQSAAGFASPGWRGCYISHVAALNVARNLNVARVLIMEDDCEFVPDFANRQAEVARWLESTPWGIAFLGHVESIAGPPGLTKWDPSAALQNLHCYAVAGDVLQRLIQCLEGITLRPAGSPEGGPMSPDGGVSWFRRKNPDVQTVLVNPWLAYQRASRSDLTPRWFDRVPGLSAVASQARTLRRLRP